LKDHLATSAKDGKGRAPDWRLFPPIRQGDVPQPGVWNWLADKMTKGALQQLEWNNVPINSRKLIRPEVAFGSLPLQMVFMNYGLPPAESAA